MHQHRNSILFLILTGAEIKTALLLIVLLIQLK